MPVEVEEIIPSNIATEPTQLEIKQLTDALLYFAGAVLDKMARLDNSDRAMVNVETGSIAVSALPTLANVTTVGTVTGMTNLVNLNNFSGGNANAAPYNFSDAGLVRIYQGITVTP
jgi:hypothetical protein